MVLLENDFWSHITRSARSLVRVLSLVGLGNAEVSHLDVALIVEYQILRLDVSVDDVVGVNVLQSDGQTSNNELGLVFVELDALANVVAQVAAHHEVADQVDVFLVLEGVHDVHDEGMLQLGQELALSHH